MYDTQNIIRKIQSAFPDGHVEVRDLTGTQDHYELFVVSSHFRGLTLVARHRLIYQILGSLVGNEIHALSIKALTPEEYQGGLV